VTTPAQLPFEQAHRLQPAPGLAALQARGQVHRSAPPQVTRPGWSPDTSRRGGCWSARGWAAPTLTQPATPAPGCHGTGGVASFAHCPLTSGMPSRRPRCWQKAGERESSRGWQTLACLASLLAQLAACGGRSGSGSLGTRWLTSPASPAGAATAPVPGCRPVRRFRSP